MLTGAATAKDRNEFIREAEMMLKFRCVLVLILVLSRTLSCGSNIAVVQHGNQHTARTRGDAVLCASCRSISSLISMCLSARLCLYTRARAPFLLQCAVSSLNMQSQAHQPCQLDWSCCTYARTHICTHARTHGKPAAKLSNTANHRTVQYEKAFVLMQGLKKKHGMPSDACFLDHGGPL